MTNKFITIETMTPLNRGEGSMGVNSPDSTYQEHGHYPLIDTAPMYNEATEMTSYELVIDEALKVVNKVYTVFPIPTDVLLAQKTKLVSDAVENMLNDSAKTRGYDSIISECSYATSTGTFGAEAQVTVDWRDAVWTYVYQVQADVNSGARIEPTLSELMLELPIRGLG